MEHLKSVFYFLTIAECGSLSRAASQLYITQPTLSHFLAGLEADLGVKLVERRNNRGLELTDAGKLYYKKAKEIAALWNAMERELEAVKQAPLRVVRCGTGGADQITRMLAECIPRFHMRYPDMEVQSVSLRPDEIEEKLLAGELNLGYSAYLEPKEHLTYIPLFHSEVDLVVSPLHPLAAYSFQQPGSEALRIPLEMAKDVPFALIQEGSVLRQIEERYFEEIRFRPTVLAAYTFSSTVSEYVRNNRMAGLCPRQEPLNGSGVVRVALNPPMYYTGGLYFRNDTKMPEAVKYLITLLKESSALQNG